MVYRAFVHTIFCCLWISPESIQKLLVWWICFKIFSCQFSFSNLIFIFDFLFILFRNSNHYCSVEREISSDQTISLTIQCPFGYWISLLEKKYIFEFQWIHVNLRCFFFYFISSDFIWFGFSSHSIEWRRWHLPLNFSYESVGRWHNRLWPKRNSHKMNLNQKIYFRFQYIFRLSFSIFDFILPCHS